MPWPRFRSPRSRRARAQARDSPPLRAALTMKRRQPNSSFTNTASRRPSRSRAAAPAAPPADRRRPRTASRCSASIECDPAPGTSAQPARSGCSTISALHPGQKLAPRLAAPPALPQAPADILHPQASVTPAATRIRLMWAVLSPQLALSSRCARRASSCSRRGHPHHRPHAALARVVANQHRKQLVANPADRLLARRARRFTSMLAESTERCCRSPARCSQRRSQNPTRPASTTAVHARFRRELAARSGLGDDIRARPPLSCGHRVVARAACPVAQRSALQFLSPSPKCHVQLACFSRTLSLGRSQVHSFASSFVKSSGGTLVNKGQEPS